MRTGRFGLKKISFFLCITLITLTVFTTIFANASAQGDSDLDILYLDAGQINDPLKKSLDLDPKFVIKTDPAFLKDAATGSELLTEFDVIFLVDQILDSANISKLLDFMTAGGGLIYIFGENQAAQASQLVAFDIITASGQAEVENNIEEAIPTVNGTETSIYESIDWNSQPEIANYTVLPTVYSKLGTNMVVDISKTTVEGRTI